MMFPPVRPNQWAVLNSLPFGRAYKAGLETIIGMQTPTFGSLVLAGKASQWKPSRPTSSPRCSTPTRRPPPPPSPASKPSLPNWPPPATQPLLYRFAAVCRPGRHLYEYQGAMGKTRWRHGPRQEIRFEKTRSRIHAQMSQCNQWRRESLRSGEVLAFGG